MAAKAQPAKPTLAATSPMQPFEAKRSKKQINLNRRPKTDKNREDKPIWTIFATFEKRLNTERDDNIKYVERFSETK